LADYSNKRAGNYTIIRKLGDGGFATVYLAQHTVLEKKAAVKLLLEEWLSEPDVVNRFFDEARTMEQVHEHANIVKIIDIATMEKCKEEGLPPYFIMEYLEGETLEDVIKSSEGFSLEEIIKVMKAALSALQYCHNHGIIHRDVKPSNFMFTLDGVLKLTDFGIAKAHQNTSRTGEGMTLGSTDYMSPEQALGKADLDHRSDIYSLGVTLYQIVCDRLPFIADNANAVALKHIQEAPKPPIEINSVVPESLNYLILKAMSKDKTQRYSSCDEMSLALDDVLADVKHQERAAQSYPKTQYLDISAATRPREAISEPKSYEAQPTAPMIAPSRTTVLDLSKMEPGIEDDDYGRDFSSTGAYTGMTRRKFAVSPPKLIVAFVRIVIFFLSIAVMTLLIILGIYLGSQLFLDFDITPRGASVYFVEQQHSENPEEPPVQTLVPMGITPLKLTRKYGENFRILIGKEDYATATVIINKQDYGLRETIKIKRVLLADNPKDMKTFDETLSKLQQNISKQPSKKPTNKNSKAFKDYEERELAIQTGWKTLKDLLTDNIDDYRFHEKFVEVASKTSSLELAEDFYNSYLQFATNHYVSTYAGTVSFLQKKFDRALQYYTDAWLMYRDDPILLNKLGNYFLTFDELKKDPDKAVSYFEYSLYVNPNQEDIKKLVDKLKAEKQKLMGQ